MHARTTAQVTAQRSRIRTKYSFDGYAVRSYAEIRNQVACRSTNNDQVRGRAEEAKGKIEEVDGKLLGDKTMQAKANRRKPSARLNPSSVMSSNARKNQLRNGGYLRKRTEAFRGGRLNNSQRFEGAI